MTVSRRRDQARRMARLPELLREGPRTAAELARHFGCAPQEIQRDLRRLRELEFKLHKSRGRPPRYQLLDDTGRAFDPVRAVVTHAMLRLLHHHAPTPSNVYYDALLGLSEALPPRVREVSRRTLTAPQGATPRILETVAAAWCYGEALHFQYRKPGDEPRWHTMHVLFMEINRTNLDWYVIGQRPEDERPHTFYLSRILDAQRLRDQPTPDLDYDPRRDLDGAWGIIGGPERCRVTLRFHRDVYPYVAHRRWPGQTGSQTGEDGTYLLHLSAPLHTNGVPVEVLAWIRSWGKNVEVLTPDFLRALWLQDARDLLDRYGRP